MEWNSAERAVGEKALQDHEPHQLDQQAICKDDFMIELESHLNLNGPVYGWMDSMGQESPVEGEAQGDHSLPHTSSPSLFLPSSPWAQVFGSSSTSSFSSKPTLQVLQIPPAQGKVCYGQGMKRNVLRLDEKSNKESFILESKSAPGDGRGGRGSKGTTDTSGITKIHELMGRRKVKGVRRVSNNNSSSSSSSSKTC